MIAVFVVTALIGLWMIYKYYRERMLAEDFDIVRLKTRLLPFFPELERVKVMKGDSSYTINKYRIFICLRDKNTNQIYDDNMLTYVILHELAHSVCNDIGHTDSFKAIFAEMLNRAEFLGLYDPSIPRPADYCK